MSEFNKHVGGRCPRPIPRASVVSKETLAKIQSALDELLELKKTLQTIQHREVYPSIEQVTEPQSDVLYLIGPKDDDVLHYEEYVYLSSKNDFVKVGDAFIDLSGFVTTDVLNSALAEINNNLQAQINSLVAAKVDILASLGRKIESSEKGAVNGIATLDGSGKVPTSQLPSYVDDTVEGYLYNGVFYKDAGHQTAITGESDKIYIDLSTNKTYRWSGSVYIHISNPYVPDEEDLTVTNDIIKFKDKAYNPLVYSGLGRVYLRKNIVDGVNILTQSMMSNANTIYVIRYDYVLGEDIAVPENCVLEFTGGSIGGTHSITGQNTFISAPLSYIFRGITVGTGFRTNGWCPEWFGAVGYDNLALPTYTTNRRFYNEGLKSSVSALRATFSSMLSSNTRTMLLHAFYVVDDEINVEYDKHYGEVKVIGCGDCGFLGYITDETKYLLNINSSLSYYNFLSEIKNFSVYLDNRCRMAGVLRFGRALRSNFYNIIIRGGFAQWEKGGITFAIPENDNIFGNIIMGCSVFDAFTKGHGLYYETHGYPAVAQTIISCRFQQLFGGCGIVSEPGTNYGFSGSIIDCEIEGNGQGAIFIPTEIEGLLISGLGWEGAMESSVDADYPISPVTIGAKKVGTNIVQLVKNLQFINSEIGIYSSSSIDYFLFMGNTKILGAEEGGGDFLETTPAETKCNGVNINISITDLNQVSSCKYFTMIARPKNVSIDFAIQNVRYANISRGECPVKFSIKDAFLNGSSAIIRNCDFSVQCTYTFIDNALISKGTKEEHAIVLDTSKKATDLRLFMDHYYEGGSVVVASMYIKRLLSKGFVQNADNSLFCIYGGGRLIDNFKGTITLGSDIITINRGVYDNISVGDTLAGPWFDGGRAIVEKKNSETEIQIDKPAVKTANNAPITGAIVLPVQMGSPATVSSLSVFENTDYLPIGASVYVRDIGKPVWWNGSAWADASGQVIQ